MSENDDVIYLTPAGIKRLKDELERLSKVERPEIADRIRESREHGEFSEDNSELDEIKFEQALIEDRISEIQTILSGAQELSSESISTKTIGIGTKVTLSGTRGKKDFTVTVVSSAEADMGPDRVSTDSPIGQALIGRAKGDKVTVETPGGKVTYEVKRLSKATK